MFATERGGPFTSDAVNRLIKRIGERAGLPFQIIATCYVTAAAMPWPMRGTIRGLFRIGLAIAAFSTRCAILSLLRPGSRTFGGTNGPFRPGPKKRKFLNDISRGRGCACVLGGRSPSQSVSTTFCASRREASEQLGSRDLDHEHHYRPIEAVTWSTPGNSE